MERQVSLRLVVAQDRKLFRVGLRHLLDSETGVEIVGEAANWVQTVDLVSALQPDVLLLDITIPGVDNIESLGVIAQKSPQTKVLTLSGFKDEDLTCKALRAGAKGSLAKDASLSDLVKAIHVVHGGELWFERKLMMKLLQEGIWSEPGGKREQGRRANGNGKEGLTGREQEILHFLAGGLTNKEIGKALFISEKTVKSHLNSIFTKLHVTRRLEAVLSALHQGLA